MYIKNSNGPRTDPWGTPDSIGRKSEHDPFITTLCRLSFKYPLRNISALPHIPF